MLSIVQRFSNRCENMDDLFQVGCIGLVKSIDNFDLKHEVRFSTYAVPMIMGEIKRLSLIHIVHSELLLNMKVMTMG